MQSNLDILIRFYQLTAIGYNQGNPSLPEEVYSLVHNDAEFHEPLSLPYGGIYKGISGFTALYAKTVEYWDFEQTIPAEYVCEREVVVALNHVAGSARSTGIRIDMPLVAVWRFEDHKIRHARIIPYDVHEMRMALGFK